VLASESPQDPWMSIPSSGRAHRSEQPQHVHRPRQLKSQLMNARDRHERQRTTTLPTIPG
jgi:hypothetical protein